MLRKRALLLLCIMLCGALISAYGGSGQDRQEQEDEWAAAVRQYYGYIDRGEFRDAYDMLSQCKAILTNAGSGGSVGFSPPAAYERWYDVFRNIESLTVNEVQRLAWDDIDFDAEEGGAIATLGIRLYSIRFVQTLSEASIDPTVTSGSKLRFVYMVKGTDGKIRILGIGTGP